MRITSITRQVKNPERVNIFLAGKYSFSLSLDELIRERLKKDQELTEAELKKLKKISADGKLRSRSLEWLLGRPHSTREFKDYLRKKQVEAELTESLIDEFTTKGYLDDEKFAQWFTDLRQRKYKSRRAIKAELAGKGISGELAEQVLSQSNANEEEAIKEIIAKKSKSSRYRDDSLRLMKYLTSQGFNYSLVKKCLAEHKTED
ncbi:MAG TPA: RecX family transcriptional regulator [Candidatus Saccharimonadales bacterium]|nr:RecX family transcriptional regulator [Candidatus Saccharimonadales bacterium]